MKVGMGEGPSGSYAVNGRRVQTDTQEVHEAGGERLADVLVDRGVQNQLLDFSYMQAHADRRGRGGTDRVGSGFAMGVIIGMGVRGSYRCAPRATTCGIICVYG